MIKVLMVASEGTPFMKTGGLGDVIGSLPAALVALGVDARVILPKYKTIPEELRKDIHLLKVITVKIGWRNQYCGIEQADWKGITWYFIDNEYYFGREKVYGYGDEEAERYAFFDRAVLEALPHLGFKPDILHCHDWQTGMVPVFLKAQYAEYEYYHELYTVFSIHNLQYQGNFPPSILNDLLDLPADYDTPDRLEFNGAISFLKGGLVYADWLTTVSKTYADEIKHPFFGEKMEGILQQRSGSLEGIINGIDIIEYDPYRDPFIFARYNATDLSLKAVNKEGLQKLCHLKVRKEVPLIAMVTRLTPQKGLDLVAHVLDELMSQDIQMVILGTGDANYEELFRKASTQYEGRISANIRFDNILAHCIYAGADLFLMPSLFEPCGLSQLISLRYGTIPIVRETGGLKDTVFSYNDQTGEGNGFTFTHYNAHDMLYTISRALSLYQDQERWNSLIVQAMAFDASWNRSALQYDRLYKTLIDHEHRDETSDV